MLLFAKDSKSASCPAFRTLSPQQLSASPSMPKRCAARPKQGGSCSGHTPELRVIASTQQGSRAPRAPQRNRAESRGSPPIRPPAPFGAQGLPWLPRLPMALRRLAGALFVLELEHDFPRRPDDVGDGHPARATAHALLHVEQSHQSSSSRSTSPYLDWQIILWVMKERTVFQGQLGRTEAALPAELEGSPPDSLMRSIPSLNGARYSKSTIPSHR